MSYFRFKKSSRSKQRPIIKVECNHDDSNRIGKKWDHTFRLITVIAALIAAGAAGFSLIFLYQQLEEVKKQNDAIWYSMRPRLNVYPTVDSYFKIIRADKLDDFDSFISADINFNIKNVGISFATIDSIFLRIVYCNEYSHNRGLPSGYFISPGDTLAQKARITLCENTVNYINLSIFYTWEDYPHKAKNKYTLDFYWDIQYGFKDWSIYRLNSIDFNKVWNGINPSHNIREGR
ncbi:MAG: hypothetical protein V3V99_02230 [candidate division Zixibacteria bacterium]